MALSTVMAALAEALGPARVPMHGPDDPDQEGEVPRIYWEPTAGQLQPPRRIGGGAGDDGPIHTRRWSVRLWIHAATFALAEALADRVMALAHKHLSAHSYAPGDETWNTGKPGEHGTVCVMTISVMAPVLREAVQTLDLEEIEGTYTFTT